MLDKLCALESTHSILPPPINPLKSIMISYKLISVCVCLCACAVVSQFYITEAENEYVIKGNAAVMKCKIPSFVADFVYVEAWIDVDDGSELTLETATSYG